MPRTKRELRTQHYQSRTAKSAVGECAAVEKDSKWPVWLGCGELQLDNFIAGTSLVGTDLHALHVYPSLPR